MADGAPQSFQKHTRWVPMYHFVASALLILNLGYAVASFIRQVSFGTVVQLLLAVALLIVFFYSRAFALAVQDRLIRLEERLRMERMFPDDLKDRISELSIPQMIGLRFASDGELADLTRKVLDEKIENRTEVKKLIKTWRPDNARA